MKKNFTRLVAAMVAGVWTLGLQAQTDVTSQYLTNAGFDDEASFVTNGVCTYAKDVEANNTTLSQAQAINGWMLGVENGDARAAAAYQYGSTHFLGGGGYVAPATDESGATGGALGIVSVWGANTYYYQEVTLLAGAYELSYAAYNTIGGTSAVTNLIGYIAADGTATYGKTTSFAVDTWTKETISFSVTEEAAGKISVGYTSLGYGSTANPHLFIDNIKLTYLGIDKTDLNNAIAEATILYGEGTGNGAAALKSAIDAAQVVADNTAATMADIEAAKTALAEAVAAYNLEQVSPENPMDMTSYIVNPTMDTKDAWVTIDGVQNRALTSNKTGDFTGSFYEHWNPSAFTGKFYQIINGLPDGKYEMKAAIFGNNAVAGGGLYLYANNAQVEVTTTEPTYHTVTGIVVSDGTLELGWKQDIATCSWIGSDNYTLTYLGYDATAAIEVLNAQITAAKAIEGVMSADAKSALDKAITDAEAAVVAATKTALSEAGPVLSAAVAAAEASIAEYAALATAIADAKALKTAWEEYETVESFSCGYDEAIAAAEEAYNGATAVPADEIAKLAAAKITYAKTVKPVEGTPLDFTMFITNPEATDGLDGWTKEGDAIITRNNEHYSNVINPYFDTDNWGASSWTVTISQELTNLPAGDYTVKCVSRSSANVTATLTLTSGENVATSYGTPVGSTGGELGNGWGNQTADITVPEGATLKIAFTNAAAVAHEWASFDEFQLLFNKKALSPEMIEAVDSLQTLNDEIIGFLYNLDQTDETYGEMYTMWIQEYESGVSEVIQECIANPTSLDEVYSWIATLNQWYSPKTITILLIECEALYASYENPSDEAGFAKAIQTLKEWDDLWGTAEEKAAAVENLKAAREAFIYENMETETKLLAWGNMTVGQIPGTEANNRLVGNEGDTAEGFTIDLTGNTGKAYSAANKINVTLPDGTKGERTTIKLSNGAQNTIYLPVGKIATKITFYSYINHNADKRTSNVGVDGKDNTGYGYRTSYWKEVAGVTYTEETATLMNVFVDGVRQEDNSVVTDGYVAGSCDSISFRLNGVKDSITFTNAGEQVCFAISVELADAPAVTALKKAIANAKEFVATLDATDENQAGVVELMNEEIVAAEAMLADLENNDAETLQAQAEYLNAAVENWKADLAKNEVVTEVRALIVTAQELYNAVAEDVRNDEAGLLNAIQSADMICRMPRWSTLEQITEAKATLETAMNAFDLANNALPLLTKAIADAEAFVATLDATDENEAGVIELMNEEITSAKALLAEPTTVTEVKETAEYLNVAVENWTAELAKMEVVADVKALLVEAQDLYASVAEDVRKDESGLLNAIQNADMICMMPRFSTLEQINEAKTALETAMAAFKVENEEALGINGIVAGEEVVAVKYYSLNGVELTEPVEGVVVVKTLYANGKVTTVKMVVKK